MLVKFFENRGAGRSSGPIDYLLGKDRDREGAKLLRGDPKKTGLLIDSLKFKQKYTAGVLSFEESNTSDENKQKIMDSFEKALLPGMTHRANIMWVEHRDKDRLELNFLIANVDLETGKRLQPYYHLADLNRVDAWKELTNSTYAFSSPNDPAKKQTQTPKTNESKQRKNIKDSVDTAVSNLYARGAINSRNDIEKYLNEQGFNVVRKTKSSITFTEQNSEKRYRLKGLLYGENFRSRDSIREPIFERDRAHKRDNEANIQHNRARLAKAIECKSREYEERYFTERKDSDQKTQLENNSDKRDNEMVDLGGDLRPDSLGLDRDSVDVLSEVQGVRESVFEFDDREVQFRGDVRRGTVLQREWGDHPQRSNHGLSEVENDRNRANIVEFTRETIKRIQGITESTRKRVGQVIVRASEVFRSELEEHKNCHQRAGKAIDRARENNEIYHQSFERNERKISEIGDNAEQFNGLLRTFSERYESLNKEIGERLEPAPTRSIWSRFR